MRIFAYILTVCIGVILAVFSAFLYEPIDGRNLDVAWASLARGASLAGRCDITDMALSNIRGESARQDALAAAAWCKRANGDTKGAGDILAGVSKPEALSWYWFHAYLAYLEKEKNLSAVPAMRMAKPYFNKIPRDSVRGVAAYALYARLLQNGANVRELADGAYKLIAAEPNAAERSRCALSAADLASDSGIFDDFMRFINISLHSSELGFTVFRLYGYPNLYDRVFEACRKQEKMPSSLGTYMRTFDCYKRKMPDSEFHKRFNWVQLMFGFAWRLNDLEPYTYPLIRYCMHCAGDAEKERKYAEMSLEIRGRMAAAYFQYAEYAMKAFARSGDTVGALKFLEPMNSRQKAYLLRRTMSDLSRNPSGLDGIVEILKSL